VIGKLHAWTNAAFVVHPLFVGLVSLSILVGKVLFLVFVFMWVRWTIPRFRYDQVMKLGWQKLLPLAIGNLIFYAAAIAIHDLKLGAAAWAGLFAVGAIALWIGLKLPEKKTL
jgi:NADH-quinone oxidoreductase subunit H